jgi:hypothetical protein
MRNAPRLVATPLPPRNSSQIGNMCPTTAKRAPVAATGTRFGDDAGRIWRHGIWETGTRSESGVLRITATSTAPDPFNASSSRVNPPSTGDLRATLVAPILPLPVRRTSSPRKMRTSK